MLWGLDMDRTAGQTLGQYSTSQGSAWLHWIGSLWIVCRVLEATYLGSPRWAFSFSLTPPWILVLIIEIFQKFAIIPKLVSSSLPPVFQLLVSLYYRVSHADLEY